MIYILASVAILSFVACMLAVAEINRTREKAEARAAAVLASAAAAIENRDPATAKLLMDLRLLMSTKRYQSDLRQVLVEHFLRRNEADFALIAKHLPQTEPQDLDL